MSLCLGNRRQTGSAVAIAAGVGSNGKAVLQNLNIQIAVLVGISRLVPNPNQISAAGGVCVPGSGVGLQNNGSCFFQSLLGEVGSGFAVLLDLTGGLRGVNGKEATLQDTALHHIAGDIEMYRIAVNIGLDGNFLLQRFRGHIQLGLRHIVHKFRDGIFSRSRSILHRILNRCGFGAGLSGLLAAAKAAQQQTNQKKQG